MRPRRRSARVAVAKREKPAFGARIVVLALATLTLLALAACGGEKPKATPGDASGTNPALAASVAAAADAGATASAPNVPGGPCYLREVWDECGLIKRLENSGYVPKVAGRDAGALAKTFTAPFVELTLGRGTLRAFIYATPAAAAAELAKADTVGQGVCPPARTATYGGTLLHSANMIAILQADNDNTCVRIGDLVTAGLPKLERK